MQLKQAFYEFADKLIELIWPSNHCLLCNRLIPATDLLQGAGFCPQCRQDLAAFFCCPNCAAFCSPELTAGQKLWHEQFCHSPKPFGISGFVAVAPYGGQLRQQLLQLKYHNQRRLAKPLGAELARSWQQTGWPADFIIPVPLHAEKLKQRGYNQCDLLAKACGELLDLPVLSNALLRVRETAVQNNLSAAERQSNVAAAFACGEKAGQLAGKNIILLDDIITTGSTMQACAAALQALKPAAIYGLAVAGKNLKSDLQEDLFA